MGYQVLARKYRPQRFQDVAGQDHVTVTLMNALTQNRIAHGYIFSGHRGIGKTTIARILACALNCCHAIGSELRPNAEPCLVCESCTEIRAGNSVDVIEIDAATNRGIDEIRELRDAARYRPSRDRFKIYILDEAHQITDAAFNALLKTLEEPPDHIVFMMATTQPEDIPQTVRSRCQHFSFHAVKLADILAELQGICEHEGVDADPGALSLLAEAGDGSMRDALSIMDQAIASAPVHAAEGVREGMPESQPGRPRLDTAQIRELMGSVPNTMFERILQAVDANRSAEVIAVANDLLNAGNSPAQLARQAVRYLRSCLIAKIAGLTPDPAVGGGSTTTELLQISADEQRRAARTAALFSEEELTRFLQVMLRTFDELGYRQEQRFHLELGLLKLVHLRRLLPVEEVLSTLAGKAGMARAAAPSLSTQPASAAVRLASPSRIEPNPAASTIPAAASARPAFSPFERDTQRRRYSTIEPTPVPVASPPPMVTPAAPVSPGALSVLPASAEMRGPIMSPVLETSAPVMVPEPYPVAEPVPVPPANPVSMPRPAEATSQPEGQLEIGPEVQPILRVSLGEGAAAAQTFLQSPPALQLLETSPTAPETALEKGSLEVIDQAGAALQRLAVEVLAAAKQVAAADALGDAVWSRNDAEAAVKTELSKTMLPVVLNPDAEKIVRAALREAGVVRVAFLPGAATGKQAAAKKPKTARAGSAQAKAMEHPMVQQAQKLFAAEIQTVIDLSE